MAQGHYSVNEERLPSVTTILKATESEEKKASLQAWKQRVGQKQAEIITREASSRGSSMHEYLEKFLLGKVKFRFTRRQYQRANDGRPDY
jgi:genome maintenance exonuclease 1